MRTIEPERAEQALQMIGVMCHRSEDARERRDELEVYLNDPHVAIDTNHLERALRAIPMGRKNGLFTWTELGAKHVGIVQSRLVTYRLHDINPYDYFVDVLQPVGQHPGWTTSQVRQKFFYLFVVHPNGS